MLLTAWATCSSGVRLPLWLPDPLDGASRLAPQIQNVVRREGFEPPTVSSED